MLKRASVLQMFKSKFFVFFLPVWKSIVCVCVCVCARARVCVCV